MCFLEKGYSRTVSSLRNPVKQKVKIKSISKSINNCLYMGQEGTFAFKSFNVLKQLKIPSRLWYPSMFSCIQGLRGKSPLISYSKSVQKLSEALKLAFSVKKRGGIIYVVFDNSVSFRSPAYGLTEVIRPEELRSEAPSLWDGGSTQRASHVHSPKRTRDEPLSLKQKTKLQIPPLYPLSQNISCGLERGTKSTGLSFETSGLSGFLGTKESFRPAFQGWSSEKWVGGTFSNFQQVSKSYGACGTLSRQFFKFLQQNKTFSRYLLESKYGHIQGKLKVKNFREKTFFTLSYKNTPDLIIVENADKNRNVIVEAESLNIPVIAFANSYKEKKEVLVIPLSRKNNKFLTLLLQIIGKIPYTTHKKKSSLLPV